MEKVKKIPGKFILIGLVGVLLLAAFASTYYFYTKYKGSEKLLGNNELAAQKEIETLVKRVGRLIEIPSDEVPTVATVSDKEKLSDQAFFQNSENGDKVLIYTGIKKAILYRPDADKIIEVAPINIGDTTQSASQSAASQNLQVAMYNGTFTAGLAKTTSDAITEKYPNITIVAKKDASKKDYTKTLVIDINGNQGQATAELATFLSADVSPLPDGEIKPDGDILVILGGQ